MQRLSDKEPTVKIQLCITPEMLRQAQDRAQQLRERNVSQYIRKLIKRDIR